MTKKYMWPSMRGNEKNTGCSMHEVELVENSSVKYFNTDNAIFSTPIIDENDNIFVGSADKFFYAVDPIKNVVKWSFKTEGVIDSAACVDDNGNLYVPSGDASLYKLSSGGEKVWEFNILENKYPRISTIFWWEGNAAVGPNGWIYAGNDDFYLYAITKDGEIKWSFPTGLQIWSAPAFNNGLVYFTSFDMCVYALNQETGHVKWKRRLKNFVASSPAVDENGNVYVTSFDGFVYSLDGNNGKINWKIKTNKSIYASVAIAPDENVFIASGDGFVYCIDVKKGTKLWNLNVGSAVWSSMVIGVDPENQEKYIVYVGTSNGLILAITPSGNVRWKYSVRKKIGQQKVGVNAGLALAKSGLVAATTAGDVLIIPYNAYQKNFKEDDVKDDTKENKKILLDNILKERSSFTIEKMEFIAPEIINPLDQIGIASLTIDVNIIKADPSLNFFTARGIQVVGEGENARKHIFNFKGVRNRESFTLEAENCDFDITAFPIPLDKLFFEFNADGTGSFRASLNCHFLLIKIIKKYGKSILKYIFMSKKGKIEMRSFIKTSLAFWYILIGRIWKSWGLINEEGYLDASGTFYFFDKDF